MTTDLEARLSQIADENGVIVQDEVPLGQWIDARERELGGYLDISESDTCHPHGCGVLIDRAGTITDYWTLYPSDYVKSTGDLPLP